MRTFNHVLSSLRITIERAFGQLVRRWGILWCCNGVRIRRVSLMLTVCAKLHNICVDRWIANGKPGVHPEYEVVPMHEGIDGAERPDDVEVAARMHNHYEGVKARQVNCDARVVMMEQIWGTGLQIISEEDLQGLPTPAAAAI